MIESSTATRILVVEDENAVALALRARLSHEGYDVFVAKDSVSALAIARESHPHVALLDINLPADCGFEIARLLDENTRGIAKIFITGSKEPGLRQQALDLGASAFIEKPFTALDLKQAISTALDASPLIAAQ